MISKIEIQFAVPVELTDEEHRVIVSVVDKICRHNTAPGRVHWPAGIGSKPKWCKSDILFLQATGSPNLRADADAPETGEPTWDDEVFYIETCEREKYEGEKL